MNIRNQILNSLLLSLLSKHWLSDLEKCLLVGIFLISSLKVPDICKKIEEIDETDIKKGRTATEYKFQSVSDLIFLSLFFKMQFFMPKSMNFQLEIQL